MTIAKTVPEDAKDLTKEEALLECVNGNAVKISRIILKPSKNCRTKHMNIILETGNTSINVEEALLVGAILIAWANSGE